jgi:hypothetical protein
VVVGHRIEQQLTAQCRTALVAQPERGDRRHVAAGTVTCDRDASRIRAQFAGVHRGPARRIKAILDTCGEFVFGGEAAWEAGRLASEDRPRAFWADQRIQCGNVLAARARLILARHDDPDA